MFKKKYQLNNAFKTILLRAIKYDIFNDRRITNNNLYYLRVGIRFRNAYIDVRPYNITTLCARGI